MKCCKKYLKVYLLETVQIYLESSFGLDNKKNQHCIVEELKKNFGKFIENAGILF